MKTKLLLLFLFLFATAMQAQEVKKTLRLAMEDLSAKTYKVLDANDDPCALVKVRFQKLPSLSFEGDIVETPQKKTNEYWVYLTQGSEHLTIKSNDFLPIQVDFPIPLEQECTYILTIELPPSMSMDEAKEMVKGDINMHFSTVKVSKSVGKISKCEIVAQLPDGNSLVDNRIREFVIERYEKNLDNNKEYYNGNPNDFEALLGFYAKQCAEEYVLYAQEMYNDNKDFYDNERGVCYWKYDSISVAEEYEDFITIQVDNVLDCGGFEVYPETSYYSFRKLDGRMLGIEMIQKDKLEEFYSAVIKKVMNSLDEDSIDEIMMMSDTYDNYSTQEAIQCLRAQINEYGLQMYIQKNAISVVFTWCGPACDDISHVVSFTKSEMQKYLKSTLSMSQR